MSCLFGHQWNGCQCGKCGAVRNSDHDWKASGTCYKTCNTCGDVVAEHQWKEQGGEKICEACGIRGLKWGNWPECQRTVDLALTVFGDAAYELPYVNRSFAAKAGARASNVVLDAHEYVGMHQLLLGLYTFLHQNPMPHTRESKKALQAWNIPRLKDDIRIYLTTLQAMAYENDKEIIQMDTPSIKKKLGMYL